EDAFVVEGHTDGDGGLTRARSFPIVDFDLANGGFWRGGQVAQPQRRALVRGLGDGFWNRFPIVWNRFRRLVGGRVARRSCGLRGGRRIAMGRRFVVRRRRQAPPGVALGALVFGSRFQLGAEEQASGDRPAVDETSTWLHPATC